MLSYLRRVVRFVRNASARQVGVPEAYARWAASYPPEAHNAFMRVEQQAMLDLLPDLAGKTVLDLACGTGRYLEIARARGAAAVFGLDLSADMLRRARTPTAALARADLAAIPFRSASVQLITCGLAVGHLAELGPTLAEMGRVLVPGGVVVYSDLHPFACLTGGRRNFSANGRAYSIQHHLHLYADHQRACRTAGLEIEDVREPSGPEIGGLPGVLAVRARKRFSSRDTP